MLPVDKKWYKNLLFYAILLGIISGLTTVAYSGVTGASLNYFFQIKDTSFMAGNWWWIPLIAAGGFLVSFIRSSWKIPAKLPGSIALANQAWVDPKSAPKLVLISAISIMVGASLGPSYGLIVMGGAIGSWLVTKLKYKDKEAKAEYALTGMIGSLGAVFSTPILAAVIGSEMAPTSKKNYVTAFIPELFAATLGFAVFYFVTGTWIIDAYYIESSSFEYSHLLMGVFLGFIAALVIFIFILVKKFVGTMAKKISNPLARGTIGGALIGVICFALPLTATSGNTELAIAIDQVSTLSLGLLVAVLIAKMFAIAISQSSGFLGGVVFPIIFLGGIAGLIVNMMIPEIPMALAVASMIAAVPGSLLKAPVGLLLVAAFSVGLGAAEMTPIAIAIVVAHVTISFLINLFTKNNTPAVDS